MPTTKKTKKARQKVPPWATAHFEATVDAMEMLRQLIHISEKGISVLRGMPRIVKVLADVDGASSDPKTQKKIETAEEEAALAQSEVDRDFPVLHGLAVVALWSQLEHFTKGVAALWLLHRKESLNSPVVRKLRIRLGDYMQLSKSEQARYLVELIEQDIAAPLKRGVSRFESLLEPFALGGLVAEEQRKLIFELQQVRNVVAHRNGLADRRLKKECPWIRVKLDHPVLVTKDMLRQYFDAAMEYLLEVFYRICDSYGRNVRPNNTPNQALQPTAHASGVDGS